MTDENLDDVLLLDRRGDNRSIEFLGLLFVPLEPSNLYNRVIEKSEQDFGYLVTPNVDHMVRLSKEKSLLPLYESAWLRVSDSRILEIFAKLSKIKLPACPGSDLAHSLFDNIIKSDDKITIIGGDKETIEIIRNKYNLSQLLWHSPPMGLKNKPDEIEKCAEFIANSGAKFHFICVGSPQQEMIAKKVLDFPNAKGVGLCLGASIDFISGKTERAPKILQDLRLEWLHRLLSEPKRMWKRYLVEGPKILLIWLNWLKTKNKA